MDEWRGRGSTVTVNPNLVEPEQTDEASNGFHNADDERITSSKNLRFRDECRHVDVVYGISFIKGW